LSAEIREVVDAEVTLERGHSGIFDVQLNGTMIFSKNELGRFPEEGEIAEIIESG